MVAGLLLWPDASVKVFILLGGGEAAGHGGWGHIWIQLTVAGGTTASPARAREVFATVPVLTVL
jgi:hypothetical protein